MAESHKEGFTPLEAIGRTAELSVLKRYITPQQRAWETRNDEAAPGEDCGAAPYGSSLGPAVGSLC